MAKAAVAWSDGKPGSAAWATSRWTVDGSSTNGRGRPTRFAICEARRSERPALSPAATAPRRAARRGEARRAGEIQGGRGREKRSGEGREGRKGGAPGG